MKVAVVLITTWKKAKQKRLEVKDTVAKVFASRKLAETWAKAQSWGIWREYEIQERDVHDGHVREDNHVDGAEGSGRGEPEPA